MDQRVEVVERLVELGFTQYEARGYSGLLGQEPMTGYALANETKIPQPKVYETLRRLEDRRAVVRVGDEPARYVAVPAEHLLAQLEGQFRLRLSEAKHSLSQLALGGGDEGLRVMDSLTTRSAAVKRTSELLESSTRHVYLSLHADQFAELVTAVTEADRRGVRIDLLLFGGSSIELRHGRVLRHSSTSGVIYRHHQARHIAVVCDGDRTLWALAPNGDDWRGLAAEDELFAAVVKGYIRHDLYVQQIFSDLGPELEERYGPGLEGLVSSPPDFAEKGRADTTARDSDAAGIRRRKSA